MWSNLIIHFDKLHQSFKFLAIPLDRLKEALFHRCHHFSEEEFFDFAGQQHGELNSRFW
jgi:hypothetical protein